MCVNVEIVISELCVVLSVWYCVLYIYIFVKMNKV